MHNSDIYTHTYTQTYIHTYTHTHIYIYTHTHIYIYTHIHTPEIHLQSFVSPSVLSDLHGEVKLVAKDAATVAVHRHFLTQVDNACGSDVISQSHDNFITKQTFK